MNRNMSLDSQQFGGSNIFTLPSNFRSEGIFSAVPNSLLKDTSLMQDVMLFKDSDSEEIVSMPCEVSKLADDLDLGYDTNSEIPSPMSLQSSWGEPSTPGSSDGSCLEDSLLAAIDDETTRNSVRSILSDNSNFELWEQSYDGQSEPSMLVGPPSDLSPGSPLVVPNDAAPAPVTFTDPLQKLLQTNSLGTSNDASTPTQTTKAPVRKRAAASLSSCGITPRKRIRKFPSLIQNLPEKQDGMELSILVQPEKHHRARYRTEGSRGSVKDDTGETFPKLKLVGVTEPVTLQVFVGIDQGKVRPHGYYQACKVTGRNTTPCEEKDVDGTTVLEVPWEPTDGNMELGVDCIGILKLRNADVEQRIGPIRSKRKSTCVRLIFRVLVPTAEGSNVALQTISRSITCTQPLGHPEIVKKSLTKCSVAGGEELFIIGKNFTSKATTEVKLRQFDDNGKVTWEGDCDIDKNLFQNTHIVCSIPPYPNQNLKTPLTVYLVVTGKPNQCSELEAHPIEYIPLSQSQPDAATPPFACTKNLQVEVESNCTAAPMLQHILPPTPTSPAASPIHQTAAPVAPSMVKLEPASPRLVQTPPASSPSSNDDETFVLTLQMLASAYLRNKEAYNNLLMQTQSPVTGFDGPSLQDKVLAKVIEACRDDLLKNDSDCDGIRVSQVQDGDPTVVKTVAEANSQAFLNAQPTLTNFAPDVADSYENLPLVDLTDLDILDDVLDVLNNN